MMSDFVRAIYRTAPYLLKDNMIWVCKDNDNICSYKFQNLNGEPWGVLLGRQNY